MSKKITRRKAFMLGLGTCASVGIWQALSKLNQYYQLVNANENNNFAVVGDTALKERGIAKKLLYGAATSSDRLVSDRDFTINFLRECAILMAEGDFLWSSLRPSRDSFNFERADWFVEFGRIQNILIGATHLVWHEALPSWLKDTINEQNARDILLEHIEKVAGRYAGKIHYWTVVNEAVEPSDGRADGLRNTLWLQSIGSDYIEIAFRAAAKADPNALLLYNDNRIEFDTPYQDLMRTNVLKLLEQLKSRDTPVHALGMQAHLNPSDGFNPEKLKNFMRDVADLGLKILITELDVTDRDLPQDINQRDRIVAGIYEDFLAVVLDEPAVMAVTTWGLSDRATWLSWFAPRNDGTSVRPLPLDAALNRKLAWNAVARAFDKVPNRQSSSRLWNAWENLN